MSRTPKPKLIWLVFRDMYPSAVRDSDFRTYHDVDSIWSTQTLALECFVKLCKRSNLTWDERMTASSLFKTSTGYAGFSVEYREVDVR